MLLKNITVLNYKKGFNLRQLTKIYNPFFTADISSVELLTLSNLFILFEE